MAEYRTAGYCTNGGGSQGTTSDQQPNIHMSEQPLLVLNHHDHGIIVHGAEHNVNTMVNNVNEEVMNQQEPHHSRWFMGNENVPPYTAPRYNGKLENFQKHQQQQQEDNQHRTKTPVMEGCEHDQVVNDKQVTDRKYKKKESSHRDKAVRDKKSRKEIKSKKYIVEEEEINRKEKRHREDTVYEVVVDNREISETVHELKNSLQHADEKPATKRQKIEKNIPITDEDDEEPRGVDNSITNFLCTTSSVFLEHTVQDQQDLKKYHAAVYKKYIKIMNSPRNFEARELLGTLWKNTKFIEALVSFVWHKAKAT